MSQVVKITDYEVMKNIGDKSSNTPDYYELKESEYQYHLVFIIDTLKKGHPQHFAMDGADYYGVAQTLQQRYTLRRVPQARISYVFELKRVKSQRRQSTPTFKTEDGTIVQSSNIGKIEGELYSVCLRHLCTIDKIMLNGHQFNRRKVWVEMRQAPNKSKMVQAWAYFASKDALKNVSISSLRDANIIERKDETILYVP